MKRYKLALIFFVFPLLFGCSDKKQVSLLYKDAPQFEIDKWLTEQPDISNKYILLDFWATWCGPCKRVIPIMNEIHQKLNDSVVVIAVSDESERTIRKSGELQRMEYYSGIDYGNNSYEKYNWQGLPFTVIIDPNGKVIYEGNPLIDQLDLGMISRLVFAREKSDDFLFSVIDSNKTNCTKGYLSLRIEADSVTGNWKIFGGDSGRLTGTLQDSLIHLNFHPDFVDNNLLVDGIIIQDSIKGSWTEIGFYGVLKKGIFYAEKL